MTPTLADLASREGSLGRAAQALAKAIELSRLGHAYLVAGPQGAGKEALCRAIAAQLLGRVRKDGTHPDLHVVAPEPGKREISIDTVRAALTDLTLAPIEAAGRVAIVLGADALGEEAANALLKTLEEPPAGMRLLLTSARPEKVLPTIRSRCMTLRLEADAARGAPEIVAAARALLAEGGDPYARASAAAAACDELAHASAGEGEKPTLELKRRAALAILDAAAEEVAVRFREKVRSGASISAEEAALARIGEAAERVEANATLDLVLEVLAVDLAES